ncbi:MAG: serine protease [Solirubrobacteraceae bacterium]|nr:serine protease [Solirubrobacteraceae bacterium]
MSPIARLRPLARWVFASTLVVAGGWWAAPALAQDQPGVIVRFESGTDAAERAAARRAADVESPERLPGPGLEVVQPEPGVTVKQSVAALERSPDVVYAEPDAARRAFATPDDRFFGLQWALRNTGQSVGGTAGTAGADIGAEAAWDVTTGWPGVVVAVVDSGADIAHPDLAPNLWADPGESGAGREANGLDDDGDGLIDDRMGWDWVQGDNQPLDGNGHGTHVSGTIAARGDDATGVAGVAWSASIMPLRVLGDDGSGRVSDVVKAYGYAARHGARVLNASLGGGSFSRTERDAIAAAPNVLFVVAAGNDGADNDATGSYPCNYGLDNVVCVAASDQSDGLASFSNYGATTVDIAAPGVNIASSWPGAAWRLLDGTSMATPHVAGAAALVLAARPELGVAGLRDALLSSADSRPALAGRVVTGGRLNIARALAAATGAPVPQQQGAPTPATPPPATPPPSASTPGASPAAEPPAPAPQPQPAPDLAPPPPPVSSPARVPLAPAAAPAPARDRIAPGLAVTAPRRVGKRAAVSGGVRVRLRCSERCGVRLRLVIDGPIAKRIGLSRSGRPVTVARGQARISSAGALTRSLRPAVSARPRLLRSASIRLTIRAEATDPSGNRRIRSTRTLLAGR